ncbi:MAG TPA: hypothetical protein VFM82_03800 [Flavobacteriaceae bacterium]|nr:hypothetical protein [Flavobacteriaceae bacterium]
MKIKTILLICLGVAFAGCSSDDSSGTTETCEKPTALTATNITGMTADLGWTEMGSATTWDIEIGSAGFTPTGEPTHANVSNPFSMTGLGAEITYEFYVRANCGNDVSDWAGPQQFTTASLAGQKNYFPLEEGNSWSYSNEKTGGGLPTEESEETMTAGPANEQNGMMYYPMETDNPSNSGFVTSIFSNGELHHDGAQTMYDGVIIISFDQLQMDPVEITMENAAILSETATAGSQLFSFQGSEIQTLNIGVMVPVTINYSVTTTNVEFIENYTTPDGEVYSDVLRADLVVSASASAEYMGTTIMVINEQDAFTSANYYANEIGLVYSEVVNNLEFEDLSSFGLPTIPDIHIESNQELTAYSLF